uniref:Uncharacterized protein n=1 Tax=Vespula pensylvanica TaxID=30213 RepID=A0A834P8Q8_VESPE|nr:hypothetical protein H0235_005113 [Vespula pensylvanica]
MEQRCYKSGGEEQEGFSKESRESLLSVQATRFDGGILNPKTISHECHTVALHNLPILDHVEPQEISASKDIYSLACAFHRPSSIMDRQAARQSANIFDTSEPY